MLQFHPCSCNISTCFLFMPLVASCIRFLFSFCIRLIINSWSCFNAMVLSFSKVLVFYARWDSNWYAFPRSIYRVTGSTLTSCTCLLRLSSSVRAWRVFLRLFPSFARATSVALIFLSGHECRNLSHVHERPRFLS